MYIHRYIFICMHSHTVIYFSMYLYEYIYSLVYIFKYISIYIYLYVFIYVYIYIYMYAHIGIHSQSGGADPTSLFISHSLPFASGASRAAVHLALPPPRPPWPMLACLRCSVVSAETRWVVAGVHDVHTYPGVHIDMILCVNITTVGRSTVA